MKDDVLCWFCTRPLDSRDAFEKVEGWAKPRKDGGLNALVVRRSLKQYACTTCILNEKHGVSSEQGTLL